MERLTRKCNNNYFYNVDDVFVVGKRLGAFEDFMERNDFQELEQLQEIIERDKFNHLITAPLEQENQALKDRWQRLKEIIEKDVKHNEREFNENYIFAFEHYSTAENWILDRMKELEEEE